MKNTVAANEVLGVLILRSAEERLTSVEWLAEALDCSLSAVRTALQALRSEGEVTSHWIGSTICYAVAS